MPVDLLIATGHRPARCGGFTNAIGENMLATAQQALEIHKPAHVISGGALGWDIAVAMKAHERGIPFTLILPHPDYNKRWRPQAQARVKMLSEASYCALYLHNAQRPFAVSMLNERNRYIADYAARIARGDVAVAALFDGNERGGTHNMLRYVRENHPSFIIDECFWELFRDARDTGLYGERLRAWRLRHGTAIFGIETVDGRVVRAAPIAKSVGIRLGDEFDPLSDRWKWNCREIKTG